MLPKYTSYIFIIHIVCICQYNSLMKNKWFKKIGWIHLPMSFAGYIIYILAIIFLFTVFTAVDRNSHSVSDTLYGIFPYFIPTFLFVEWIASKTD